MVQVYEEHVSAAKTRPEFERMMRAAHEGEFEVLVVWALDRFGRSTVGNLQAVLTLDASGIQVISVREPWLDTGGAVRPLLIAIFSWVAEQERTQLVERTKAGLERARRRGVKIGRPERHVDVRRAQTLRAVGLSVREVAKRLRTPATTLFRAPGRSKKSTPLKGS